MKKENKHDRAGKPCTWSGDGRGVTATMWAERVWSPDAAGAWHLWSGTSAATPKAYGVAAVLGLNDAPRFPGPLTKCDRCQCPPAVAVFPSDAGIPNRGPALCAGCLNARTKAGPWRRQ